MDLHSLTLHEAQQRLVAGDLTAVRLTEAVLERIDSVEPTVRAFLSLDRQGALRQAEAADAARAAGRGGPLCGLPLALKDVLCTTDLPTTCGSPERLPEVITSTPPNASRSR